MARVEGMLQRIIKRLLPTERRKRIAEQAQNTTTPVRREGLVIPPTGGLPELTLINPAGILPNDGDQTPPIH